MASPAEPAADSAPIADIAQQTPRVRRGYNSLFFSPEQMRNIGYAINFYRKNAQGRMDVDEFDEEDFLSRLSGMRQTAQTNRYYEYPQFFLESLVYHESDNWVIWINGQKITQVADNDNSDLKVMSIDTDKVVLQWKPGDMEMVNDVWRTKRSSDIIVNQRAGTVQFTLRPNQTFSSYAMEVLEGKVKPVTIDTHRMMPAAESLPVEDESLPPQEEGAPAVQGAGEGLPGLINSYQQLADPMAARPADTSPPPSP
ncbi:MAG: hypothetical protein SFW63_03955 [Alphaproteobacteria bacterium]|nr:hypothetical protein [Alphaproteobacteria bacterium]